MNTIPNILTTFRILLIPIIVVTIYLPFHWTHLVSALIFAIAAITDWFDGWVARRWNQTTSFGAFLDPVADKLMVVVTLVALIGQEASLLLTIPSLVIIGREIVISALREWMAELGKRASVAVSYVGKLKTTVQMVAIVLLLYGLPLKIAINEKAIIGLAGIAMLYIAAFLTLWSMWVYINIAKPVFFQKS